MSIFIETLNVYRTVSKLLLKCSVVFFAIAVLILLILSYALHTILIKKGLKLTVKVVKIKLKLNVFK